MRPFRLAGGGPEAPEPAMDEAAYDRFVRENLRRNYIAHFTHGCLGMTGFRLIFAPTFVPAYLFALTGSPFLVGLGQSLLQVGAIFSPVIGATRIEHQRRVLPAAVSIGTMMRVAILGLALSGWILSGAPLVLATFFFLTMLGFYLGSQRVAFQFLMAKVIPVRKRGQLQAWRNLFGGAIAAALSFWAGATLIENDVLGNGYAATFMISFVLTSAGLSVLYLLLREPDAPTVRERKRVRDRLREFPKLIEDRDYRNFLLAQLLTTAGRISLPFCILYAGQKMEVDGTAIGLLSVAFLGADTVSNLVWGYLGDRRGFRAVMILVVLTWIAALLVLIFAQAPWQFFLAFFGLGAAMSGYLLSAPTLVLEFGDRADVPMRLALSTTAETSMAALGPLVGGLIASAFGFVPVFVLAILFLAVAAFVLVTSVKEPRYRFPTTG
ncbi:MFS transporter [Parvularcula oceani]|uniref:MFS transporter n=1 Tax=Parvularcula oceani TaxID=1247963 RepID=UPI00192E6E36|nr:MFS transporter [Parvularcula oceani]